MHFSIDSFKNRRKPIMSDSNEELSKSKKTPVKKAKTILLRVSDPLYDSIKKAIDLGIADNASEFVRRCVVNQLLDLKLIGLEGKE
jgi:hypothetical protein